MIANHLHDGASRSQLDHVLSRIEPTVKLRFVDTFRSTSSSAVPTVLVTKSLPTILRFMKEHTPLGVLKPLDISFEHVSTLADEISVHSHFTAEDFGIPEPLFIYIAARSRGITQPDAAELAGYSDRHARRLARSIVREAGFSGRYPWPMLSPIFPP